MGEPPPEINMRNWLEKEGLNQKPINLTMKN